MTPDPSSPKDKSVGELFADTLKGEFYDNEPWEAIETLRRIASQEVLQGALAFCVSDNPLERARGLNVLSKLGRTLQNHDGIATNECLSIALKNISDPDERIAEAAAWALAHLGDEKSLAALLKVQDSSNPDVRHALAYRLSGETSRAAISANLKLMEDIDEDVRDWATFRFALPSSPDSLEIREALHRRLTDPFEKVRQEALWALSLRKDLTGLQLLLKRLEDDDWVAGDKDTAEEILELSSDTTLDDICAGLRHLIEITEKSNPS